MSITQRHDRIGGSDAPLIMGANTWQTLEQTWNRKVFMTESDLDNIHVRRGNAMEPFMVDHIRNNVDPTINSPEIYAKWDAEPDNSDQITLIHPKYPFVMGHPDGIGEVLWEFKAPAMRTFERIKINGLSDYYKIQVQHYLSMTDLKYAYVCFWDYDKWDILWYPVKRNEELHAEMMRRYVIFWDSVQEGRQAVSNGGQPTMPDFGFPEFVVEEVFEPEEADVLFARYATAYEQKYFWEDELKEAKSQIITKFKPQVSKATELNTDNYSCRITKVNRDTFSFWRISVNTAN